MHCSTSNQKEVIVRAFYLFVICKLCGLEMRTGWAESNVELQLDAGSGSTLHAHRHDFLFPISRIDSCLVKGHIQCLCSVCIVGIDAQDFAQFCNSILPPAESA